MTEIERAEWCLRGACLAWDIDPSDETMRTLAELCDTLAKARRAIVRGREAMPAAACSPCSIRFGRTRRGIRCRCRLRR